MDSMDLMRKSEEIVVGSMRESGLAEEQAKSLEEQRQRFEEAKRTEIAGKGVKEPAKEQKVPLPWEMTDMLDEVLTWTKVKVETSAPVKAAANAV